MFQVYHLRDKQFGMVIGDNHGNPTHIRWSCGYIQRYVEGRFIRRV